MATLIEEFDALHETHMGFCKELTMLVTRLLEAEKITTHSIASRKKERSSFLGKISKKGSTYRSICDITDIIGIRIITYFADQVDAIAELIEKEFDVDKANSVDKRASLESDRFGYLSLHYVVSLPASRLVFRENKRFTGVKAEIQIRSILQHAWAEIEHDLGYKTNNEIPSSVKRQFARLSGLLELGDKEFMDIRDKLKNYATDISFSSSEELQPAPIDRITLLEFVKRELIIDEIDRAIASAMNCKIRERKPDVDDDVDRLAYFNVKTIADLKHALAINQKKVIELARLWGEEKDLDLLDDPTLPRGISIYYLCHILAGATGDIKKAHDYYEKFHIGSVNESSAYDLPIQMVEFVTGEKALLEE